jgi:subtilisin-like proprotein convertase family protein
VNNGFEGANSLGSGMVLLSNAFYGENPTGTWTLRAIDSSDDTGHGSGNITQWTITVYGH